MKTALRTIDKALKDIYQIDARFPAEDFVAHYASLKVPGALLIKETGDNDREVGIHLCESIQKELSLYSPLLSPQDWTYGLLNAFSVAAEEISHFNYFTFHACQGRSVAQIELEVQGEVDKFLLLHFSHPNQKSERSFNQLFEQVFTQFRLIESLTETQKTRYQEANLMAKKFILEIKAALLDPRQKTDALHLLRQFYRLPMQEKLR
jgi:hypothetical protein